MLFQLRRLITLRNAIYDTLRVKKRVALLVDGFNLYHSLDDASKRKNKGNRGTKWLNLRSYMDGILPLICAHGRLQGLYYFSAYATHRLSKDSETIVRHNAFIGALKSVGFQIQLGGFKKKRVRCHHCKTSTFRHEEKGTDVSISIKLLELAIFDHADIIVIMSGDTDLIPAILEARRLAPEKKFIVVFPHGRQNTELAHASDGVVTMTYGDITSHQFPPIIDHIGSTIVKPAGW
jgi:uncharacterized LabA/DUF88 family protein